MSSRRFQRYQGVTLLASEVAVLKELESQYGEPVYHIEFQNRGIEDFSFIEEGRHIIELNIFYKRLENLPESVFSLKKLKYLNLLENGLCSLSESIGNLRRLVGLDMRWNNLETLPESFGQLSKLQNLNLSWNQLRSLPVSFGNLSDLQVLTLQNNQLSSLTNSFGELTQLIDLDLRWNNLKSLPANFGNLSNLQRLYLHKNQLQTLPESFGQLQNLRSLQLTHNQLESLPKSLKNFSNLEFFSFTGNPLGGKIALFELAQTNPVFHRYVSSHIRYLFDHSLIPLLDPNSFEIRNIFCPHCGIAPLMTGKEKQTGQERVFCLNCENIIH
ncbi:MAG: leucine-rich repeat domain-containing protein [Promethearchaeota archaeon]